jgi:hypothetical protein
MITFDLGGATIADAATVRSFMLMHGINAVIFWKDTKRSNDESARAKILCLVRGVCNPSVAAQRNR